MNGDHKLDFKEFQNALHHEGITVTADMERECFDDMDRDRTGFVNSEEFIVSLRVRRSDHSPSEMILLK